MEANLDDLSHQLAALTERFAHLGTKLAEAAGELQAAGAPPAEALVEALGVAREEFAGLRADVLAAAEAADIVAHHGLESLASLEPLLAAVASVLTARARRAALERARAGVLAVLDRVLEIVHRDDPDFAALRECQAGARELRAAVLELEEPEPERVQSLTESIRAFSDLLTMVQEPHALNDERYARLEESVSTAFGRSLAVAVSRGRLAIGPIAEEPQPTVELQPAEPEPQPPPERELQPEPTEPSETTLELEHEAASVTDVPLELEPSAPLRFSDPEPPPLELESAGDTSPAPASAVDDAAVPTIEPAPEVDAEPESASPEPEPATPDETAQWWLAAWARWSGWKSTLAFADAAREEIGKYPYLLSVPIRQSADYEDGLLAYGYSLVMEHVEKQTPGCIGNALNSLAPGEARPVGEQLYEYLVIHGRLAQTYPDFVRDVMLSALPEPGFWFSNRLLDSREDTRVFQRPSGRLGESEQTGRRLSADGQRFADHRFALTLAPLTTRFVVVLADHRDARGLTVSVTLDGAPGDCAWFVTIPAPGKASAKIAARRATTDGTALPGLGRDYAALWIGAFNADPAAEHECEVTVSLRKEVRSPFAARRP